MASEDKAALHLEKRKNNNMLTGSKQSSQICFVKFLAKSNIYVLCFTHE